MGKGKSLAAMQKNVQQFHEGYIQSPKYTERLKKQKYLSPSDVVKDRLSAMKNTRVIDNPYTQTEYHFNNPKDRFITFNRGLLKESGYKDEESVLAHEYSHSAGGLEVGQESKKNLNLNQKDFDELKKRNQYSKLSESQLRGMGVENEMYIRHDMKPSENKAYLDALRFVMKRDNLYDAGKQDFKKSDLERAKKTYKNDRVIQSLFNNYKDDDVIWLMNNVAKNKTSLSQMKADVA